MMVTISSATTVFPWQGAGIPNLVAETRTPFLTGGEEPVTVEGTFLREPCTLDGDGRAVTPEVECPSTEDSPDNPNARIIFSLEGYVGGIVKRIPLLSPPDGVKIPASPALQTFTDLVLNTTGPGLPPTPGDRTVGNLHVTGDTILDGTVSGAVKSFNGRDGEVELQSSDLNGLSGAGLVGVGSGTGGVSNTGSTSIDADTNEDGLGVVALRTRNQNRVVVENDGFITEFGPLDGTNLAVVVAAVAGSQKTVRIATPQTVSANLTIPSNITLEFTGTGLISVAAGQTLTIRGPVVAPRRQIFFGSGALSLSGNNLISEMPVEWFGGKGDNSTDCTPAIQKIINIFAAAGKDVVIRFYQGKYVIAGALQDTSLSNAQIVLPKVSTLSSMLSITFKGSNAPATPWNNDSGTILRSTLTTGSGVMIGVKNDQGMATLDTASKYISNASSNIYVALENITLQLPVNPTNSALDLSKVRNYDLRNVRVVTGDFAQGGANPVVFPGTAIPDLSFTIPTTATSYGVNFPTNLINNGNVDGLFVAGFYTHLRTGELTKGRNIVLHGGKVGFQVEGAIWPSRFENVTIAYVERPIKATGAKPDQVGYPDTVHTATILFDNVGVETDPFNPVVYVVDDPNNYLSGSLGVFYGAGVVLPLNPARPRMRIARTERPHNFIDPYTEIFSSFTAQDNAVLEIRRGLATSDNTKWAALLLSSSQSGTSHLVGGIQANNEAASGAEKRLAGIYVWTDGATDNGRITFAVTNGGGR